MIQFFKILIFFISTITLLYCVQKDNNRISNDISNIRVNNNDSLIIKYPLKIDSICHYNIISNNDIDLFKKQISIIYDSVNDGLGINRSLNHYYFCIYLNSELEIIKLFIPDYNSMDKSKVNATIIELKKMDFKLINNKNICDIYSFDINIHLKDSNHRKIVSNVYFAKNKEDYINKKSKTLKSLGGVYKNDSLINR